MKKTFCNSSQSDDEKNDVAANIVENVEQEMIKCDLCIFETKDEKRMKRHTFENHSDKGKYICIGCKREFDTRKFVNNHNHYGSKYTNLKRGLII